MPARPRHRHPRQHGQKPPPLYSSNSGATHPMILTTDRQPAQKSRGKLGYFGSFLATSDDNASLIRHYERRVKLGIPTHKRGAMVVGGEWLHRVRGGRRAHLCAHLLFVMPGGSAQDGTWFARAQDGVDKHFRLAHAQDKHGALLNC